MVRIGEHINLKTEEDVKKLSSYEIFISLYQQLKSGRSENEDDINPDEEPTADKDYYKLLPANFFDLIVVDECHRGSLNEEKSWHEMLEYFGSATQIGLTVTPKQTNSGSNLEYFGDPVYVYSLKQGITDGFLSPYVVMAHELDIDRDGYKPKKGEKDIHGKPLEDRVYQMAEFDRKLIIDERRKLVATKITEFLKEHDRFTKTIVFCETEEHAGAMRDYLANENADLMKESNQRYVMRITANDQAGKDQIKNFSSTSQKYPVIAVTSKLLSTGVDTKTVGLIVLDKTIGSMTEFKQTIGRGTRIVEKYQFENESEERTKTHFVIMDFRQNYKKFDDPDFDGIVDVVPGGTAVPLNTKTKKKREIFRIKGVDVELVDTSIRYLDDNMNLVREESVESCVQKNVEDLFPTFDDFYATWSKLDSIDVKDGLLIDLLISEKVVTKLREIVGKEVDMFDLVCHFGYGKPIVSKQERVNKARELIKHLNPEQQKIMNLVIDLYEETDFSNINALSFCKKNYCTDKRCIEHYKKLTENPTSCFQACPYGLVSYLLIQNENKKIIFTSLREKSRYRPKNKKFQNDFVFNLVLPEDKILQLLDSSEKDFNDRLQLIEKMDNFDAMEHEVKKLNSSIKDNCDSFINLFKENKDDLYSLTEDEYKMLFKKIKTLYVTSNLINLRYSIYDYEKDPNSLISDSYYNINIHGKFVKCSKILENYKESNAHISFYRRNS